MLLRASILSLGFLCITNGNPSQLRLSHSGYEIISFNEQNPDEIITPGASKNSTRNYNGIGLLNLEKVNDPLDEIDEISSGPQQQKRHYESHRSNTGSKTTTEIRHNMIELPSKESSDTSSRRTSVYLTLGIPRRFVQPDNQRKDSSNDLISSEKTDLSVKSKIFQEQANHRHDRGYQEKIIGSMTSSRIKDKKQNQASKSKSKNAPADTEKFRNRGSNKSSKIHESEIESVFNLNKIKALVLDAHRGVDFLVGRSDSEEKIDRTESPGVKSGFPLIAKLPSIQIHNPRNFWLPSKIPAMYSPIYPSGFDILTSDTRQLSRNLRFDSTKQRNNGRTNVDVDAERRKIVTGHEANDIASMGTRDFVKSWNLDRTNQRIPSFTVIKSSTLNGITDDSSNLPSVNGMSVNLADLLPFSGARFNILPSNLKNQRTTERHKEQIQPTVDLSMLHRHSEESVPMIDVRKIRSRDDDLDSKYLDSKLLAVNNRISKAGSLRADVNKSLVERSNITDSQPSLLVDILHEITTPDDYDSTYVDVNKEETDIASKDMRDFARPQASNLVVRNKCKRMKNLVTPMFYQFLAKFSDTVIENALQYEMSLRTRDNTSKLIDFGRKKVVDDEISQLI